MSDINVENNVVENEEGEGTVYQLSEDEYMSLVTGLSTYKQKYEETAELLKAEKANVADCLMKIEELKDRVKNLENNL